MRVVVTGATGFIGGHVARALAEDGHAVLGFGRREGVLIPGVRMLHWDLAEGPLAEAEPETAAAIGTVDAVVHAAALTDDTAPRREQMLVTRDGTRHVREAFPGARFVLISSSSVSDLSRAEINSPEFPATGRPLGAYAAAKAEAEHLLEGTGAIILRPHAVYGPGDDTLLPRLEDAVVEGRVRLPGGGAARHSLTGIDNLVQAVRLALRPEAPGGIYSITDAEPVVLAEAVTELLGRRGIPVEIRSVPVVLADLVAGIAEPLARLTGTDPGLTRYAVAQLGRERTYDLSAARSRLGYRPAPTDFTGAEDW